METESNPGRVTDHAFRVGPGQPWWERCWHPGCHLGAAAHTETDIRLGPDPAQAYRCPNCVRLEVDPCPHQHLRTPERPRHVSRESRR
jgi:hypothetical protein